MKKSVLTITLTCFMTMSCKAQIYPGDSWAKLPTMNLYDSGMTNMYLRALAETAARRQENFQYYSDLAVDAFVEKLWNSVIHYVNEALDTGYYNGDLYFLRGYAYEQNGNLRAAKKDYKKGVKYDCPQAAQALEDLKAKQKRK